MSFNKTMMRGFAFLAIALFYAGSPAFAEQVARQNYDNSFDNLFWVDGTTPTKNKQTFYNNLDYVKSISILLKYSGPTVTDLVTLKIGHACGGGRGWQYWGGTSITLNNGATWATIDLPPEFNLNYGEYYIVEVSTKYAQIGFNVDRYVYGRRVFPTLPDHTSLLAYPAKKEDLVFVMNGTADRSKAVNPEPTTNIACPAKCHLAFPTENNTGGAKQQFNVLVQQYKTASGFVEATPQPGSFWGENVDALKLHVRNMVDGDSRFWFTPGLRNQYPWNNWVKDNKMNFYIVQEAPSADAELYRGFFYCANIDASIQVTDFDNVSYVGKFFGWVHRGNPPSATWGLDLTNFNHVLHEVFGHGFGLKDEYGGNGYAADLGGSNSYSLNSGAIGCSDSTTASWSSSYLNVTQLKTMMQNNRDTFYACWSRPNTQAGCELDEDPVKAGVQSQCHYLPKVGTPPPYFGTNQCVPKTVVNYNIGGGGACYIGGGGTPTDMSIAQPNSTIMSSTHGCNPAEAPAGLCTNPDFTPRAAGYHPAVESQLNTLMSCVFAPSCAGYDYSGCAAFQDKWTGVTNSKNLKFLQFANACAAGGINRRR